VEDGEDLKARGNFTDHEYEIKRDGDVVATISKRWFRLRGTPTASRFSRARTSR